MRACAIAILAGALSCSATMPASAQQTIRIGELNSYEKHPAFLQPYKKGWQMAMRPTAPVAFWEKTRSRFAR